MVSHQTIQDDAWAWVREDDPAPPDVSGATVHVLIPDGGGQPWLPALIAQLFSQTVRPTFVSIGGTAPGDEWSRELPAGLPVRAVPVSGIDELYRATATVATDYVWVLTGDVVIAPDIAERLLRTLTDPSVATTGPVVMRTLTKRTDPYIEWVGETLTTTGVPVSPSSTGEVNQGQIDDTDVLGVPVNGLLIRSTVLREVDGFGSSAIPGLETGVLVTARGQRVVVTGSASISLVGEATGSAIDSRRAGMSLASTLSKAPAVHGVATVIGTTTGAVGHLLVRDPRQAGEGLRALSGWMKDAHQRKAMRARLSAIDSPRLDTVSKLRPGAGTRIREWGERVVGQLGDWIDGFTVRVDSGSALDDLTSNDAVGGSAPRWRLSPALVGILVMLGLSIVSVVSLFGTGSVVGQQWLPAPSFAALWQTFLDPVAGQPSGSGAPWVALVGLLSLFTAGNVDLALFLTLILIAPVTWLVCYRLLRQVLTDQAQAVVAAALIAMSPVLVGALNRGDLATPVALLFTLMGVLAIRNLVLEESWRWVAAVAICVAVAGALFPLIWIVTIPAGVWAVLSGRVTWVKALVAVLAPAITFAPWIPTLWRWPGRLLTGPEPALSTGLEPDFWLIAGRDGGSGLPPLWLSIAVVAALWLIAIIGTLRVGRRTWFAWGVMATGLVAAVALSRLAVDVPPGATVQPEVTFWLVVMLSGLVLVGAQGSDGIGADLRGASVGWRQIVVAVLSIIAIGATVLASGWWVMGGAKNLERDDLSAIAPYVRNAGTSPTPMRTLAIRMTGENAANWALLEGDLPRLGDGERGLSAGGSQTVRQEAEGVVHQLLVGASDDALVEELQQLGVGYVWVSGGSNSMLSMIGNTPGFGVGSGDEKYWVWQVPDSGRAVITSGQTQDQDATVVGPGSEIATGADGRILILSEPHDPRWVATIDGKQLDPRPVTDWRQQFVVGEQSGTLTYHLRGTSWWAWVQLGILIFAAIMVAPSGRKNAHVGARGAM